MAYRRTENVVRRLAARQDAIVAAARDAAGEGGMMAVQIAPVAARAGIAAGTVYRYFPGKTDLVGALIASAAAAARVTRAVLDVLARDYETRAVLMYAEGIVHARKFMSAARGLARLKPVIVLKAGRHAAAAQAAASHTGSMAGRAAAYDALFERYGVATVRTPSGAHLATLRCMNGSWPGRPRLTDSGRPASWGTIRSAKASR